MENITMALAPVFAAGFAVQQVLEIPGTLIDLYGSDKAQQYKKVILGVIGVIIGCILAMSVEGLGVLRILLTHTVTDAAGKVTTVIPDIKPYIEVPVTGLIISAGTEGLNSILKFMKYSKEDKKNAAAAGDPSNSTTNAPAPYGATKPVPTPEALDKINLK